MREEAEEWFESAKEDLDTARYNFEGDRFSYAAFLCQQAAEKALKAVYIDEHGENVPTHNVVRLSTDLDAPDGIIDACAELNQLYVETRYPDALETFTQSDVETFLSHAQEVIEWTETQ